MPDETGRRSGLVGGAADVQAAWHRLYERLMRLEFDGYAGADTDVFLRAMETVLNAHRATPEEAVGLSRFSGSCSTKPSRSSTGNSRGA